jgi:hypothetical protein
MDSSLKKETMTLTDPLGTDSSTQLGDDTNENNLPDICRGQLPYVEEV